MADTRWCWITIGTERVLAFRYKDPHAGPSAKGAVVSSAATPDEVRTAVDHPDRTVRDPDRFGAVAIGAEDALHMGLPRDPPWIGFFENKPVPPPRGEDSRVITAIVLQDGEPVQGVHVELGELFGHELLPLDKKSTDALGRAKFPLGRMKTIAIVAKGSRAGSKVIEVHHSRDIVEVPIQPYALLAGAITRGGAPCAGHVTLTPRDGGVLQVERCNDRGMYRVGNIVPGEYDVEVKGIDARTHMSAGTPAIERMTFAPGEQVTKDFVLVAGTRVSIRARLLDKDTTGNIYLLPGTVSPATSVELRDLLNKLGRGNYHAANSTSYNDTEMSTELLDVVPGAYTLCIEPWDRRGAGHREQPVTITPVTVQGAQIEVTSSVPRLRAKDAGARPAPPPPMPSSPTRNGAGAPTRSDGPAEALPKKAWWKFW